MKYTNIKRGHHESGGANDADRAGSGQGDDRESPAMSEVPKIYKKVAIKLTKLGSDEFDFDMIILKIALVLLISSFDTVWYFKF